MIRRLLLGTAMMACASCQPKPSSLRLSAATFSPGAMALNIDLQDSEKKRPAAIQWSLYYSPATIIHVSVIEGTQLRSFQKHLVCSSAISRTTCIVWGGDAAPIPAGTIASAQFELKGSNSHPDTMIALRDVAASSREGAAVQLASPSDSPSPNSIRVAQLPNNLLAWAHARYSQARSTAKHLYHSR